MRAAAAEALVNLCHGERLAALRKHIEHGAARTRQANTATRKQVR
jgi:hypothetical protein